MRIVGVFNDEALQYDYDGKIDAFTFEKQKILLGYVNDNDPYEFDAADPRNEEMVLVRKRAFSMNYRDKGFVTLFYETCQKLDGFGYSGFGSDFVATVVETGKKVNNVIVGQRVIPNAAFPYIDAEKKIFGGVPSNFSSEEYEVFHYSKLVPIPDIMPDEVAASFTVGSQTCYSMLRKLDIQENSNVLVTAGRSNTSMFFLSALKARQINANVYVLTTSSDATQNDLFYRLGVKEIVSLPAGNLQSDLTVVDKLPMFQYVMDPLMDIYFPLASAKLDFFGKYITCGAAYQSLHDNKLPSISIIDLMKAALKNVSIIGNCIGTNDDLTNAIKDYEQGRYEVLIDSVYEATRIGDFMNRTYFDKGRLGKVVCFL